jgi:hypothetical protein
MHLKIDTKALFESIIYKKQINADYLALKAEKQQKLKE